MSKNELRNINRVFEAIFSNNRNNLLLTEIINAMRKIHKLPPITRVVNSRVQNPSLMEVLLGRKMIEDAETPSLTIDVQVEPYALAPYIISINVLGYNLPALLYSNEFCTCIVQTNYDAPENFFMANKYSEYYCELLKLKEKEQFAEKYHELREICKVFEYNTKKQDEGICIEVITSPIAQMLSNEFRKITNDPQLMDNRLTDDEFRQLLIERDIARFNESRNEGKIELYFTEMGLSVEQIAEKLSMDEGNVITVLKRIGLI